MNEKNTQIISRKIPDGFYLESSSVHQITKDEVRIILEYLPLKKGIMVCSECGKEHYIDETLRKQKDSK